MSTTTWPAPARVDNGAAPAGRLVARTGEPIVGGVVGGVVGVGVGVTVGGIGKYEDMARQGPAPFVGRADQLELFAALLTKAAAGEPAFALVSGDAGAGKTRLLGRGAELGTDQGFRVHLGSCVQMGDFAVPYLPIVDILRSIDQTPGGHDVLAAEASARPILAGLLPHLSEDPVGVTPGSGQSVGPLYEAVHRLLSLLAEQTPVLLVIEDLHWADTSTRDLLAFLARTMRRGRVAIVASYRTDDLHRRHPLRPWLAELTRLPTVQRISLEPFTRAETAALLDGMAGRPVDPAVIDQVFRRSEGNAFYSEELWDASGHSDRSGLPADLRDVLLTRADDLRGNGRDVLDALAVAGRLTDGALLEKVIDVPSDEIDTGLRQVIEAGLLVPDGDGFRFRHALVQEAVYSELMPGRRVRWHRRFADVVTAPAERAAHLLAAHDLPAALVMLCVAARRAESIPAPGEALRHLEKVAELIESLGDQLPDGVPPLLEVYSRATRAATMAGDVVRAVTFARAALAEAQRSEDVETIAARYERLARALMDTEYSGLDDARQAVELLKDRPVTPLTARAWATLARASFWLDPSQSAPALRRAVEAAEATGAVAIAADALVTGALMIRRGLAEGDPAEQLETALRLTAGRPEAAGVRVRALRFRSVQLFEDGQTAAALDMTAQALAFAAEAGQTWTPYGLDLQLVRGWVLDALGRWDEAIGLALPAAFAEQPLARILATLAVALLGARGDAEAEVILRRLQLHIAEDLQLGIQLALAEVRMRQALDQPELLLKAAESIDDGQDHQGFGIEMLLMLSGQLSAHADLAERRRLAGEDPADEVASGAAVMERIRAVTDKDRQLDSTARLGPYGGLLVRIAEADAARLAGHDDPTSWAKIAEMATNAERAYESVWARWREANARLAAGDRGRGTLATLKAALSGAQTLGMAPLAGRVRELAKRARLRLDRGVDEEQRDELSPLTARETEVLGLLAAGRTNRQIAQALFISDKTASVHVSNILGKLGAASRTEAAAIGRERGLITFDR